MKIDTSTTLILQFNNNFNDWEDITENVSWYNDDGNSYAVRYKSTNIIYHKSYRDFKVLKNPSLVYISDKNIYIKDRLAFNIKSINKFDDWYKVYFENNETRVYNSQQIEFKRDIKKATYAKSVFAYLQEVADFLSLKEDHDFLSNQLENLIIDEHSVLGKLFDKKLILNFKYDNAIIYPFTTNLSQKEAVKNALHNDISIIQGPPGTGKTQTILNIIANILFNNGTVAVLSGNNEATKNVFDKLSEKGFGSLNAYLGNKENVEDFFSTKSIDFDFIEPKLSKKELLSQYIKSQDNYDKCLRYKFDVAKISQQIEECETEKQINDAEYAIREHKVPKDITKKKYTSKKLLELASVLEILPERKVAGFFNRARLLFRYGIISAKKIADNLQDVIEYLKNKWYDAKIAELNQLKEEMLDFLKNNDFGNLEKFQQSVSLKLFVKSIFERNVSNECFFTKENYKAEFRGFVKKYPIIYSTTHAIRQCVGKDFLFDYALIDESSQVDLITMVIAFSCAKHVVLVGDEMQLPNVINTQHIVVLKEIFSKYKLNSSWNYAENNVLRFLKTKYSNIPNTLLKEHYRCDPQIIGFCNKRFYSGQLVIHTQHEKNNGVEIIKHGSHLCRGRINEREVECIDQDILKGLKLKAENIGIIAPYRDQITLLKNRFGEQGYLIDTIHKFQGREKDCIILSTVVNKIKFYEDDDRIDFLNNPNLINVAISRAKKKLYILVSEEILQQEGTILRDLAKYYEYYCDETKVQNTKVYSVFDLMYDDYAPILQSMKERLLHISDFESENIIATVIADICAENKCGPLAFKHNFPLKNIIKLTSLYDEKDIKFVSNINTHCDFVIYNTLNKAVELVVEVDGSQHKESIQTERDRRKDRLLSNAGIKILRLPTTAINCKEKIIEALK